MITITAHENGKDTVTTHDDNFIPYGFDGGTAYQSQVVLDGPFSYNINGVIKTGWVLKPKNLEPGKKYPVLYLLHGLGNPAYTEWVGYGNIQQIIGNLMVGNPKPPVQTIKPMIIVMPDIINSSDEEMGDKLYQFQTFIEFMKPSNGALGIMDYINRDYPVYTDRSNTSIAGISYGGMIALYIACVMQDKFYSTGGFSPSGGLVPNGMLKNSSDFSFGNGKDHFVLIGKGNQDTTVNNDPDSYKNILNKNGNNNIFCTLPGSHNWTTFKNLLYIYLQYSIFDC